MVGFAAWQTEPTMSTTNADKMANADEFVRLVILLVFCQFGGQTAKHIVYLQLAGICTLAEQVVDEHNCKVLSNIDRSDLSLCRSRLAELTKVTPKSKI